MPLDPQKKKQMDAIFKNATGVKPQEAVNGALPPIQNRIAELKSGQTTQKKTTLVTPKEVFGEMAEDVQQVGQGVKEDFNKRLDEVDEIKKSDVSQVRKATQTFGQGLGLFQDVLGQGFKGVAKLLFAPEQEQQIKEGVGGVVEKALDIKPAKFLMDEYAKLEETNPAAARDVDTAINTLMTALDVATFGAASAAKNTAKEGLKTGVESAIKTGAKAVKTVTEPIKFAKDVGKGLIGKSDRYVNSAITKAFNLTQGDVKNIAQSTFNEPGKWVADNNLIRGNVEETKNAIKEFGDTAYKNVRDEIAKVDKTYNVADVPRYTQALEAIIKQVAEVPGLESVGSEVATLLKKETVTLADVQRSKELLDEVFNLYKATGDVKDSTAKEGLAQIRKDMKQFIEKEVKDTTTADIAKLNNDVATARSIEDAISTRSTRGLTRSNIGLGDLGAFSAGSFAGGPIGGVLAVIIKKIIQSPEVGLKFAKYVDKLSDAKKLKLKAELEAGNIPEDVEKLLDVADKQVE